MSKPIFKLHIADELNHILRTSRWDKHICKGVVVTGLDITDQMMKQVEQAMAYDKHHMPLKKSVYQTYVKLLYDILPLKSSNNEIQ